MQRNQTIATLELLREKERRQIENKLFYFKPYDWQKRFFAAGLNHRQRMLMAANRVGKTISACYETTVHLTGLYPGWWEGVRFNFPINAWAMGVSGEQIRDVLQKELFVGLTQDGFIGGGMVPLNLVGDITRSMTPKLAKDVKIKHITGGYSHLSFKSYSQGQHVLMGPSVDLALIDEEPTDTDIWPQVLTRTLDGNRKKGGHVILAFTPENGWTELVTQFKNDIKPGQYLQKATWDEAPHLDEEAKRELLDSYPSYQRDMRSKGDPLMGSGLVFLLSDERVEEPPLENIPRFWPRIIGIDFGWDHPTALVWVVYDPDNDIMHVTDCWREREKTPTDVAGIIHPKNHDWIPIAWPHDGLQHDKGSGQKLAKLYEEQSLNMLSERATFEDGSNGVEAGVFEMYERMSSGRLKVAKHLHQWFEEKRMYHRAKNQIVKLNDDLLCATRYAMMMLRHAETEPRPHNHYQDEMPKQDWY